MFGYIIVNKPEMKIKEFACYQSYYCGLCRKLKEKYGIIGQSTLSYDLTFLYLLLTSLYEPSMEVTKKTCVIHPFTKHDTCINVFADYVADMNLILSYYKCKDDWEDEKKYLKLAYAKLLHPKYKKIEKVYLDKINRIWSMLENLSSLERRKEDDIDTMAGLFGNVMAEIFSYRQDEWGKNLWKMGFFLGKFVYIMDAYEDIEKDHKDHNYNPYAAVYQKEGFDDQCYQVLTMMITECAIEFEQLPIIQNIEILRNIIYSGVWTKYESIREKREKEKVNVDE